MDPAAWGCSAEKLRRVTTLTRLAMSWCKFKKHTIDCWTVWILRLLQSCHGQRSLNPDVRKFVCDTDKHGLVDSIEKVVIDLGVLCHTAQQLVDQLTWTKTHGMAADFMRLKCKEKKNRLLYRWKAFENNGHIIFTYKSGYKCNNLKSSTLWSFIKRNNVLQYFTSNKKLKMKLKNGWSSSSSSSSTSSCCSSSSAFGAELKHVENLATNSMTFSTAGSRL